MNLEQSTEKTESSHDGEQHNGGVGTETPCVPHETNDSPQADPSADATEKADPKETCAFGVVSSRVGCDCTLRRLDLESMQRRNKAVVDGFVKWERSDAFPVDIRRR